MVELHRLDLAAPELDHRPLQVVPGDFRLPVQVLQKALNLGRAHAIGRRPGAERTGQDAGRVAARAGELDRVGGGVRPGHPSARQRAGPEPRPEPTGVAGGAGRLPRRDRVDAGLVTAQVEDQDMPSPGLAGFVSRVAAHREVVDLGRGQHPRRFQLRQRLDAPDQGNVAERAAQRDRALEPAVGGEDGEPHVPGIVHHRPSVPCDGELEGVGGVASELAGPLPLPDELAHQFAPWVHDRDPHRPGVEDVQVAGPVEGHSGHITEGVPVAAVQRADPVDLLEPGVQGAVLGG